MPQPISSLRNSSALSDGPIGRRLNQLQRLAHRLDKLGEMLDTLPPALLPDALDHLRYILSQRETTAAGPDCVAPGVPNAPGPETEADAATVVGRMRQFFRDNGNVPASAPEIAAGTGAPYETVRSILYKRNRGRFLRDGASRNWQLAESKPSHETEEVDAMPSHRTLDD